MPKPSVGRIVHYVSYGTPGGEYTSQCRAALVSEVGEDDHIGLVALNPTGLFFHGLAAGGCHYDDGAETAGDPRCLQKEAHGDPFRYCSCGWREASYRAGSWHWPERVDET